MAADVAVWFPPLGRLIELSDQPREASRLPSFDLGDVRALLARGREMSSVLYRQAHGQSMPGAKEPKAPGLKVWYLEAGKMDQIILALDPSWYREYWERVFHSDHKFPRAARRQLRRQGNI
jgi:hypothetical protein